jgi:hypothetical protein
MSRFKFNPDNKTEGSPFTNGQRAYYAQAAAAEADHLKQNNPSASYPSASNPPADADHDRVTDLLTDLAHLCDRSGWDFEWMLKNARFHWQEER